MNDLYLYVGSHPHLKNKVVKLVRHISMTMALVVWRDEEYRVYSDKLSMLTDQDLAVMSNEE